MEQHYSSTEKTVYCPVKQGKINGTDCLVICDVADRMFKPSVIPEGIPWSEEQRQICKQCKYHNDQT